MKEDPVAPDHPLVGTWASEEEYFNQTLFVVSVENGQFIVKGRDENDQESFEILETTWDGETLRFTSLMPSTAHRVSHVFRARTDGRVDHEFTLSEVWKKRTDDGRALTEPRSTR